jgi:hypothetical protein
MVMPPNRGRAKKRTPKHSVEDVAEVSATHLSNRLVFVSYMSLQEVIGDDSAPSLSEELARMSPAELHSCCTQLDDYFRDGFRGYLKEVTVVAQYQEQLLKWSDGIMEAHNEVIARWDEFQEILHLHPQGTVVGTFLIPCVV